MHESQYEEADLTGVYALKPQTKHYYQVWATENQAQKAWEKHFKENSFCVEPTLCNAILTLLKGEAYTVAMDVLSRYSVAQITRNRVSYTKMVVTIVPSEFLGDVFD